MKRIALVVVLGLVGCNDKKPTEAKESPPAASAVESAPAPSVSAPAVSASSPAPSAGAAAAPDAIAAQHVLVSYAGAKGALKSITRSKAEAKKRAEEVVAKAKAGTEFTSLVMEYSDDPGSKVRMGSLGKFTREKMTKPFSDAAFALAVSEVSGVVETDFGFHVIKRNQ